MTNLPIANVVQPLIDATEAVMVFFHDQVGFGWGVSIIALTVVVRLAILPLTFRQIRSMQELQRLQPEIKRIQERYKDDRQRQQQEMMAFYREHKVNPLGSCLPLLLQLPFFIALFYMLRKDLKEDICGAAIKAAGKALEKTPCDAVAAGSADFAFIPDLTDKATGGVLATLVVLYIVTQLGSGLVTAVSMDRNQRIIILALPFLFVSFIISFPTGLILYWITTNVWTVGQQLFVKRFMPAPEPIAPKEEKSAPARGKPPSPKPAAAAAAATGGGDGGSRSAPPARPRKKKKRSGRRR